MPPRPVESVAAGNALELCPLVIASLSTPLCTLGAVGSAAPPRVADAPGGGALGGGGNGGA